MGINMFIVTRHYCFICHIFFVSASPLSGRFPFSRFPVQFLLFTPKPFIFTPISQATWDSTCGTDLGACVGGGPCVDTRHLQPRTWCYQGAQFNLLARYLIPGPSPDPVPAGDWGAELCRSSVSRTSQRRL